MLLWSGRDIYKIAALPKGSPEVEKHMKTLREKPDKIDIEQFDIQKECQKVFNDVKKYIYP